MLNPDAENVKPILFTREERHGFGDFNAMA
jgi:hypothetical protein